MTQATLTLVDLIKELSNQKKYEKKQCNMKQYIVALFNAQTEKTKYLQEILRHDELSYQEHVFNPYCATFYEKEEAKQRIEQLNNSDYLHIVSGYEYTSAFICEIATY